MHPFAPDRCVAPLGVPYAHGICPRQMFYAFVAPTGPEPFTYKRIYQFDLGGATVAPGESRKINLTASHNADVCLNAFGRNPRLPILDEDIA